MNIIIIMINLLPAEINNNKETGCDTEDGVINKAENREDVESTPEIRSKVKQQTKSRQRRFQKRNKKSNSKVSKSCLQICHSNSILLSPFQPLFGLSCDVQFTLPP